MSRIRKGPRMEPGSRRLLNVQAKKGEPAKYSEPKYPKKRDKKFQMIRREDSRECQW